MRYIIFSLLFGFIFIGCDSKKDDIDIGFVAGLSGKYSILGNDVRDGFFLAFDEIDYKIGEQKINIIEKDDKQDVNENKKVINELLEKDIKLIVGNSTSSMTLSSLNIIKNYPETFLFSATASSGEFSKKDDQLIRVQVEQSNKMYIDIIKYLIKKNKKNIVMIYDSRNSSYVSGYNNIFQKLFIENGGDKFIDKIDINEDYKGIINRLNKNSYDAILVVANSLDSAKIIQYIKLNNISKTIFSSGWAKTNTFIKYGGKAVENVLFSTGYNEQFKGKDFLEFQNKFKLKYNRDISEASSQGYEVAKIIIENLKISTDMKTLKNRILKQSIYKGLQHNIILDKFGDASKKYFIMEVKDAKYIQIK